MGLVLNEAAVLWAFDAPRWIGGEAVGAAIMAKAPFIATSYGAWNGASRRIFAF